MAQCSPGGEGGRGKDKVKACSASASSSSASSSSASETKRQRKKEEEEAWDPLFVLGPEILEKILGCLDARSVARCILVSRGWHSVASCDQLWAPRLSELWTTKAHIPRCSQVRGLTQLRAYSLSVMDGKRSANQAFILEGAELRKDMYKVRITKEDLCDHVWEYRFQVTAPEYWRNLDPSWKNTGPPMRRYFHPDGSHTADPGDKVWGGHESNYSIITSYVGDGRIRQHYVRINRWAPLRVSRLEDWSWEMSNDLYCYNSIPDANKPGGTGPLFPVW